MRRFVPDLARLMIWTYAVMMCLSLNGCGQKKVSYFDVPAGPASLTLKEFAEQAEVEIVFESENIEKITTKPIQGNLHHREALRKMLKGTPCIVGKDTTTGAFAVTVIESP